MQRRGGGRIVVGALCVSALALASVVGQWASAGAAGIVPPSNPPANISPSGQDYLTSIDSARAAEGVGPLAITESSFDAHSHHRAALHRHQSRAHRPRAAAHRVPHLADQLLRPRRCRCRHRPGLPDVADRWVPGDVRRVDLGRRTQLDARGRLLLDVRRRVRRAVGEHLKRRLWPPRHSGVLGTPRTSSCTRSHPAAPLPRPCPWVRPTHPRATSAGHWPQC